MAIGSQVLRSRPLSSPRMTRVAFVALLDAIEPGQIALEEAGQAVGAVSDGVGGDDGVVQEGLGLGVIQERHGGASVRCSISFLAFRISSHPAMSEKDRLQ